MSEDFPPLYRRLRRAIGHRHAAWVLGAASAAESIVSPLPPDFLLAPMSVAAPERAFRLALLTTLASVLGGVGGYLIGAYFMDYFGWPLVDFYQLRDHFEILTGWLKEYGAAIVLIGAVSPVPYKAIAILSGIVLLNPFLFIILGLIGRGARFFAVAALCRLWGARVERFLITRITQSDLRGLVSLIFLCAMAVIAAAFYFEYVKGLAPCILCLWQRWPYYLAASLCFAALFLFSERIYFWVLSVSGVIFLGSALLAGYHAGVEWGFWAGPSQCGGGHVLPATMGELRAQLAQAQPASCEHAAWRLFGISFAGYNVIISIMLAGFIAWRLWQWKNKQQM